MQVGLGMAGLQVEELDRVGILESSPRGGAMHLCQRCRHFCWAEHSALEGAEAVLPLQPAGKDCPPPSSKAPLRPVKDYPPPAPPRPCPRPPPAPRQRAHPYRQRQRPAQRHPVWGAGKVRHDPAAPCGRQYVERRRHLLLVALPPLPSGAEAYHFRHSFRDSADVTRPVVANGYCATDCVRCRCGGQPPRWCALPHSTTR